MDRYESLKLKNQLCFPLYAASREVVKHYRPLLDPYGLTYTQYIALMVLWEERQVNVKTLGERLYLDSGTLTPLLKSLEQKGYVTRTRSKEDERVLIAAVTEQGLSLREELKDVPEKLAGCVCLNAEDAAELYRILYKILGC
ncbi:MAG: MarR family transcriptional regulator [Lachnospiraceae bacterium]|nr:MarR family transcriptional regulator [Lachnospiraceae bacterium]